MKLSRTVKFHPALFGLIPIINVLFLVVLFFSVSSRFVLQPGIAIITPLIGLLGTVTGLIETFVTISSHSGLASTTDLSGGIYQSLLTTAAGLVVAIPAFVAYSYLSSRVNALMRDMERGGIEVVSLISGARDPEDSTAQIIDFKSQRRARGAD